MPLCASLFWVAIFLLPFGKDVSWFVAVFVLCSCHSNRCRCWKCSSPSFHHRHHHCCCSYSYLLKVDFFFPRFVLENWTFWIHAQTQKETFRRFDRRAARQHTLQRFAVGKRKKGCCETEPLTHTTTVPLVIEVNRYQYKSLDSSCSFDITATTPPFVYRHRWSNTRRVHLTSSTTERETLGIHFLKNSFKKKKGRQN